MYGDIDYSYPEQLTAAAVRPYRSDHEPAMTVAEIKDYLSENGLLEDVLPPERAKRRYADSRSRR
jgi:hypothetical protein